MESKSQETALGPIVKFLNTYYQLFIVFIGIIGNSTTIIIFWRTKLAHSKRTSFYLINLAISDIVYLLLILFFYLDQNQYWRTVSDYRIICKLYTSLCFIVNFLSCILVLTFTVQRLCCICYPLRTDYLSRSKLVVGILLIFACIFYSYPLFIYDIEVDIKDNKTVCKAKNSVPGWNIDAESLAEQLNFVDSVFTLVIPFFGLVIMNAMIIRTLKNSSYNFVLRTSSNRHFSYEPPVTTNNNHVNNNLNNSIHLNNRLSNLPAGINAGLGLAMDKNSNDQDLNSTNSNFSMTKRSSFKKIRNFKNQNSNDHDSNLIDSELEFDSNNNNNNTEFSMKHRNSIVRYKSSNNNQKNSNTDSIAQIRLTKVLVDEPRPKKSRCFSSYSFMKPKYDSIFSPKSNSRSSKNNKKRSSSSNINNNNNNNKTFNFRSNYSRESSSFSQQVPQNNNNNNKLDFKQNSLKYTNNQNHQNNNNNSNGNGNNANYRSSSFKLKNITQNNSNRQSIVKSNNRNSIDYLNVPKTYNNSKRNFNDFSSNGKLNGNNRSLNNRTSFRISSSKTNSVSRKITKMLIVVSTTFLFLNLPVHSFNVYTHIRIKMDHLKNSTSIESYTDIESDLREIFYNIFYTSFSCNFILYSISGVTFRTEFKRLVYKLLRINHDSQTLR